MKCWATLGPYNAIDLMRLPGRADADRWRAAAAQPMAELGLALPEKIETVYSELIGGITSELNKPFAQGDPPLRFFLVDDGSEGHYFGATFDHWIADSPSFRFVTRRVLEKYEAPGVPSTLPPLQVCKKRFSALFGSASLPSAIVECARTYLQHIRAYRINIREPLDLAAGFQHVRLPDGLIHSISEQARKLGVTVNDIFLAAAAQTMGYYIEQDQAGKRGRFFCLSRDRVAVATAVDIRPLASEPLDFQFGCFLSYFTVYVKNPEARPLQKVAKEISAHTSEMKSRRQTLRFFQNFRIAARCWDIFRTPRQRAMMIHRVAPTLGGISNVNLTDTWIGKDARILDYIRVSPTGPLVPAVFTLTTIGGRLGLCFTHRKSVFTDAQAKGIVANMVDRLNSCK
jgi:hypothetical protein